jgi:hypothetical protein
MPRPFQRLTPRQRRIWSAALAIAAGTLALGLVTWKIDSARQTDLADARANVSADFLRDAMARTTRVRFTDVTATSGLHLRPGAPRRHRALPEDNGSGLAWGDYDGDGRTDLYVVNHPGIVPEKGWSYSGNRLFHNNGDGTFTDVTEHAGVADPAGFGMGATWVDYDDDGRLDLYVTNRGPNRLYHNQGDGTFVDVAAQAGVADPSWSTGAAWGDFDRDGYIDLYVCNYVRYDSDGREPAVPPAGSGSADYEAPFTLNPNSYDPQPNRLYRNRGDGTFEDVTARAGVADPDGRSFAATFVDLNGDGWLDLYVANDDSPDRLYRNTGADRRPGEPVTFFDFSALSGIADPRGSMGLSVADLGSVGGEDDGLPDLFITHWISQENALYRSVVTSLGEVEYCDKSRPLRLAEISIERVGWGCAFADFDLDGRVDLAVANGSTLERNDDPSQLRPEPMFLFIGDDAGFHDVAPLAGEATARPYNARGLAVADFDNDGDVDFALAVNQGEPRLLRNDTDRHGNHALVIRLRGRAAWCFGAKVEVWAAGRHQVRWWQTDVSYLSMHGAELIFGLGPSDHAERVRVTWTDGRVSEQTQVPAGTLTLAHPTSKPAR